MQVCALLDATARSSTPQPDAPRQQPETDERADHGESDEAAATLDLGADHEQRARPEQKRGAGDDDLLRGFSVAVELGNAGRRQRFRPRTADSLDRHGFAATPCPKGITNPFDLDRVLGDANLLTVAGDRRGDRLGRCLRGCPGRCAGSRWLGGLRAGPDRLLGSERLRRGGLDAKREIPGLPSPR